MTTTPTPPMTSEELAAFIESERIEEARYEHFNGSQPCEKHEKENE